MQSRTMSAMETVINTTLGYCIAVVTQMIVFPWFGFNVSHHENMIIALIFTCVSLGRSYLVRRFFVWLGRDTNV